MGLISDCETHFGSKDLYQVLGISKESGEDEIKRAFRRLSLKHHPDRFPDAGDEERKVITSKFQVLSKVAFILSDKNKRDLYDASGVVPDEDMEDSEARWYDYWRCLFPEISVADIESYIGKYIGSEEERKDLKELYLRYEGDLDPISESMIGFDEDKHRAIIEEMIESEEVPAFEAFTEEPKSKRTRRMKKAEREAKAAEKEAKKKEKEGKGGKGKGVKADDDLVKAIQSRHKQDFTSLIDRLTAKYGGEDMDEDGLEEKPRSRKRKARR